MKNKRNVGLVCSAILGLALTAQAQTNFVWTNSLGGAWGTVTKWGTNSAPLLGGSNDYVITFNANAALSATNDRADTFGNFALNQLIFSAGTNTIYGGLGTNLVFTNNISGVLPYVFQNTATTNILNIGVNLATNTLFGGSGNQLITLNSNVFGTGALIVNLTNFNSGGNLQLTDPTNTPARFYRLQLSQ